MVANKRFQFQVRRDANGNIDSARVLQHGVVVEDWQDNLGSGYEQGDYFYAEFFFRDERVPEGTYGAFLYLNIKNADYDGEEPDWEVLMYRNEGEIDDGVPPSMGTTCVFVE